MARATCRSSFFFFNTTATTEIYTLSLHDALPIYRVRARRQPRGRLRNPVHRGHREHALRDSQPGAVPATDTAGDDRRSEEHTSELQSGRDLVCRLLLEKKKQKSSVPRVREKQLCQ